jgi:endonuclease G
MTRIAMLGAALWLGLSLVAPAAAEEFQPGPANDPDKCKELWEGIGLPQYGRETEHDAIPVCHTKYVLSHNSETKTPDWVLEHLTKSQLGKNKRPQLKFQPDADLPEDKRAVDDDYRGSKFDRGHQAPSADFSGDPDWMVESFFLSNIVPQVGAGFNRGIWKNLEDLVRDLVQENRGELYIITGPVYPDEDGKRITIATKTNPCRNQIVLDPPKRAAICGSKAKCEEGVTVPAALFKIIYDPNLKRANAFILPNINHRDAPGFKNPVDYLKKFQTSVQVVEKYTDLEFFRDLSTRDRAPIVEQCTAMMLH